MSMIAIFACGKCGAESVRGRYKGNAQYDPEFHCWVCVKKTEHHFVAYKSEADTAGPKPSEDV